MILPDVEIKVFSDFAVILQRLAAGRFLIWAAKGHFADLQQLRRGEKRHVGGIVEKRVAKTSLVHQDYTQSLVLGINGTRQSSGSRSDHEHVKHRCLHIPI